MQGRFDELPGNEVYAGVVRRTFDARQATVTSYSFAPGASFPVHRHPQEQITLIESGEVMMRIGDGVEPLSAGAWSVVDADVEHGIVAGPDGAQIVAIIVPRRSSADAYTVL